MKKPKFFKSLLVAAGLLVGASAWADTETVTVLSEDYESYTAGDITATMQSNGWTFQSKSNKNQITIVQGTSGSANETKYFDFYYPDAGQVVINTGILEWQAALTLTTGRLPSLLL